MKVAGIILVMVGTGLAAAYGSQNSERILERQTIVGQADVLSGDTARARQKYCRAPADNAAVAAAQRDDGCVFARDVVPEWIATTGVQLDDARHAALLAGIERVEATAKADTVEAAGVTWKALETRLEPIGKLAYFVSGVLKKDAQRAKRAYCRRPAADTRAVRQQQADGCTFKAGTIADPEADIDGMRIAWLKHKVELAVMQKHPKASLAENEAPGARLGAWFDKGGVFFIVGLVLIIAGGVLVRRAIKAQVAAMAGPAEAMEKKQPKFIDFGAVLAKTRQRVDEMAEAMAANQAPTVGQLDAQRDAILQLQDEAIVPMVEARSQLIARYGMGGFAEVFGPFSGGERWINRAWVALVDHHWEEAKRSLEMASLRLSTTREALDKVVAGSKTAA